MFIFTAHLSRRKLYLAGIGLILLLAAILVGFVLRPSGEVQTLAEKTVVKSADDRIAYLASLGWQVEPEPIEERSVTIPETFSDVYEAYNAIQLEQGFDLKSYSGKECVRYTYKVLNYPNAADDVVVDLLVYRGKVIGGDVQSVSLDGFMHTLVFPEVSENP